MEAVKPRRGEMVINPHTKRMIKVGGSTWLKLVKEGMLQGEYEDDRVVGHTEPGQTSLEVEQEIRRVNRRLPKNQHAVRGRGRFENKLVIRRKQLSAEEVTRQVAETAAKTVINNIDTLAETKDEDIESILEQLILDEMMKVPSSTKPSTFRTKFKGEKGMGRAQHVQFVEVDPPDDFDDVEDY